MATKTTQEAFEELMNERAVFHRLGYSRGTWGSIVHRYRKGELGYDKIYEVLEKAGYKVVKEREWKKE